MESWRHAHRRKWQREWRRSDADNDRNDEKISQWSNWKMEEKLGRNWCWNDAERMAVGLYMMSIMLQWRINDVKIKEKLRRTWSRYEREIIIMKTIYGLIKESNVIMTYKITKRSRRKRDKFYRIVEIHVVKYKVTTKRESNRVMTEKIWKKLGINKGNKPNEGNHVTMAENNEEKERKMVKMTEKWRENDNHLLWTWVVTVS